MACSQALRLSTGAVAKRFSEEAFLEKISPVRNVTRLFLHAEFSLSTTLASLCHLVKTPILTLVHSFHAMSRSDDAFAGKNGLRAESKKKLRA